MDRNAILNAIREVEIRTAALHGTAAECGDRLRHGNQAGNGGTVANLTTQDHGNIDNIARKVGDVLGTYDALLIAIGQEPLFTDCLAKINS